MTLQRVIPYNPRTESFSNLVSLEDALVKGYDVDDQENKIEHISLRCYPAMLFHAMKIVRRNTPNHESIAHIERIGTLYGVSLLAADNIVTSLIDFDQAISDIEDIGILMDCNYIKRIEFATSTCHNAVNISVLAWVKNWIVTNSPGLGLNYSQLCLYALIYGLSRGNLTNRVVREHIQQEREHFERYLQNRHMKLGVIRFEHQNI